MSEQPPPPDVRLYGPNEAPHVFAVHELVVYAGEGEERRVVKVLRACPAGWREVQP